MPQAKNTRATFPYRAKPVTWIIRRVASASCLSDFMEDNSVVAFALLEGRSGNKVVTGSVRYEYNANLPLGPPSRSATTQGLTLCTNGDVLIGRADNGWATVGPSGSWLGHHTPGPWEDGEYFSDWPQPLGAFCGASDYPAAQCLKLAGQGS
ncbi:hypothetical protein WJX81_008408 [Elliptochloris bilobata]|uniref:Uncharacterized protein n=1 Tax=Elliptochloris bilobata TaxID=381761 RepID=A0AAW1RSP4_9CHLO